MKHQRCWYVLEQQKQKRHLCRTNKKVHEDTDLACLCLKLRYISREFFPDVRCYLFAINNICMAFHLKEEQTLVNAKTGKRQDTL